MKTIKSLTLVFALLLVLVSLVACKKDKTSSTTTNSTQTTTELVTTLAPTTTKKDVTTTLNVQFFMEEVAELSKYNTYTINYTLTGNTEEVQWTSSDETVAIVSNGVITGKNEGTCVVSATVNGITRTCNVTVTKNISYPVLVLSDDEAMPRVGGELEFAAYILFNNEKYMDAEITWVSSDESIATVNNGVITGVSIGECKITVSTTYNGVDLQEFITVTVVANPE